jgi:hypothetical protein
VSAIALPEDAQILNTVDDPGAFALQALDRAKSWLVQAQVSDLPEIVEAKARAEAIRCYIAQKELGKDAELAAAEIVRRAERRLGQLVREGQEEGVIAPPSRKVGVKRHPDEMPSLPTSLDYFVTHQERTDAFVLAGASDAEFEEGLADAKAEANVSRANVTRRTTQARVRRGFTADERVEQIRALAAQGYNSRQIAEETGLSPERVRFHARNGEITLPDRIVGITRALDSNRIVRETVSTLDGAATGAALVDFSTLDAAQIEGWVTSLNQSMPALRKLHTKLKEMTQ